MNSNLWTKEEDKVVSIYASTPLAAKKAAKQAKKLLPNRTYVATLLRLYSKRKTTVVKHSPKKSFRVEMMKDHVRLYF